MLANIHALSKTTSLPHHPNSDRDSPFDMFLTSLFPVFEYSTFNNVLQPCGLFIKISFQVLRFKSVFVYLKR